MKLGSHSGTSGSHPQYFKAKRRNSESCASMRQVKLHGNCKHTTSREKKNRTKHAKEENITEQKAIPHNSITLQYDLIRTRI